MAHAPGPSTNKLLRTSSFSADASARIYEDLGQPSPTETNLLVITYGQDLETWVSNWKAQVGELPDNFGLISVGEQTRSAVGTSSPQLVESVPDPRNLTGLGIQTSQYLERWSNTDATTVICFDSLTALLQFVETDTAFQFLHVLSGRVESVDGQAYYCLNPNAHDRQTVATFETLMDAVINAEVRTPQ